ncbi:MAG: regulatory protein RecX [Gammaproteobacteria bacterium]|nr:regulatory protein RecX [Gammaproteobacteria bacterium]
MSRNSDSQDGGPKARDIALRLLTRREHAAAELVRKLEQRGLARDKAREVVAELREAGWQSDVRYASEFASAHAARGDGPLKIRAALQARGVGEREIGEALASLEVDWLAQARQVRAKRFGVTLPSAPADQARQLRFLQTRGFPPAIARQAVGSTDSYED